MDCIYNEAHEAALETIVNEMASPDELANLAELYKVLGDETRVRILSALVVSELCVGHLAEALGMQSSAISHQLRVLKAARLVRNRKEGRTVYYSLNDDHVEKIFRQGLEHVRE